MICKTTLYLKISFSSKRLLAHSTPERLVAGVRAHVDLQRGRGGEVLAAHPAQVLGGLHRRRVAGRGGDCN